jgi:hypothetical protein
MDQAWRINAAGAFSSTTNRNYGCYPKGDGCKAQRSGASSFGGAKSYRSEEYASPNLECGRHRANPYSELRPALKSEYFIETVIALASQGKTNAASVPNNFIQFTTILNEHYGELFVTNPPVPVQKFTAKLIGGSGKLLGYKGYIPFSRN